MRFPANCVIVAIAMWLAHPLATGIRFVRNPRGRWHCIWLRSSRAYEFYAPGRTHRPYWQNLLYVGYIRQRLTPATNTGCIFAKSPNQSKTDLSESLVRR